MEAVKSFNEELSGIYETKPPISRAKMTLLTKKAIKGIKYYKHIVQSMEKFVQKCRPEYKVPGLYVIDSVVRQSRHQFGPEKDVFMPRLCKNIITTFQHIYKCPPEEKPRVLRVLNLWQKNSVFPQDVVQQLTVMGEAAPLETAQSSTASAASKESSKFVQPDQANLTNLITNLLSNPDTSQIQNLAKVLSSSQQNQLEGLLKQVKGADQPSNHKEPSPPPQVNIMPTNNVHRPPPSNQPSFYAQALDMQSNQPSFNREVLDFDYGDDDQTPPAKIPKQSHSIDLSLLAKLPTADQIQQLTGAGARSGMSVMDTEAKQRQRLEEEQAIFNKQIQELEQRDKHSESISRSEGDDNRRRKRTRSRSQSRDGRHHRHRKRSHSRDRHRSRRSRSREHSRRSRRSLSKSRERRRDKKGFPPVKEGFISVCTTTLWIGNISSKVMQHELQALVEEYGKVESINMIPPRGCAYVCLKDRREADRALHKIKYCRLGGKSLKCDWAPGKEMPEELKETWVKDLGVNYVEISNDPTFLRSLNNWGCVDLDSVPEHRRAELNPPDPQEEPVPEIITPQPSIPQMVQSFSPAIASAPAMIAQPQMPVMVRPFQLNPFGMQQQMAMASAQTMPEKHLAPAAAPSAVTDTSVDMKLDSPGSKTPTNDEKIDEASVIQPVQLQPQPVAQFRPQFGAVSVAQRFPGTMPVQLQMMPNMGQQVMSTRMGMMPMRIGVPMQLRPGFHPGMQRLPIHGHHQVLQNQHMQPSIHQRQPMIRQQGAGFPPNMRVGMPRQPPIGMIQRSERPVMGRPPAPPIDRQSSNPCNDDQEHEGPPEFSSSLSQGPRGFHNGPGPERPRLLFNRPSMVRPREFGRPPFDPMQNRFMRPPRMTRLPMGMNRPPLRMDGSHRFPDPSHDNGSQGSGDPEMNIDQPSMDMGRPPRDMNRPPRDMNRPPRDMDRPSRDMDRPSRDMDRPPRDTERPPRDTERPPRDTERPPRDTERPPRDTERPPRDTERPPRDMDKPPRDMDRPPRDMNRPPRDVDRPPRDMDRPPRDADRPPRDADRPPRDADRPPRDSDRPPRDSDRSSRERRDYDRGRRERSRERDRRDRDTDRDRRGRDRDADRDRRDRDRDMDRDRRNRDRGGRSFDRGGRDFNRGGRDFDRGGRDFDRGGRDFDRRDRGSSRGGRGGFRGRDDRGRGGFRGRDDRGRGRGGGFGDFGGRRSPSVDPEEEEYQRKRQETLRKRHEADDEYVVEEIDFSAFGLPSGFGGPLTTRTDGDSPKPEEKATDPSSPMKEHNEEPRDKDSHRHSPDKNEDAKTSEVAVEEKRSTSESEQFNAGSEQTASNDVDNTGIDVADSIPFQDPSDNGKDDPVDKNISSDDKPPNVNGDPELDAVQVEAHRSPGTPTVDEQGNQVVVEEIFVQETDAKDKDAVAADEAE